MFLIIFVIAKVGFSGSLIFYDSMMVDVTTDERMDEVSSHGYAWGYIGSCVPFVISLLLVLGGDKVGISTPAAMTAAFFLNAAWWGLVTIPLLKNYEQKYYVENQGSVVKESFARQMCIRDRDRRGRVHYCCSRHTGSNGSFRRKTGDPV